MCGLAGFFTGCDLEDRFFSYLLCDAYIHYKSPFKQWNQKAGVR